jgi:hypothetical protein
MSSHRVLFVPVFPWKYLFSTKQEKSKEIKESSLHKGEVPIRVCSPEVWEHPWAHALLGAPSSREHTRIGTSPTTKRSFPPPPSPMIVTHAWFQLETTILRDF